MVLIFFSIFNIIVSSKSFKSSISTLVFSISSNINNLISNEILIFSKLFQLFNIVKFFSQILFNFFILSSKNSYIANRYLSIFFLLFLIFINVLL